MSRPRICASRCNAIVLSFTDCYRYRIAGIPKRHPVSRGRRLLKSYAKDSALSESLAIMTPLFTFGQPSCWPLLCGSEQCGRVSGTNSPLRDGCSSIPGEVSVAVLTVLLIGRSCSRELREIAREGCFRAFPSRLRKAPTSLVAWGDSTLKAIHPEKTRLCPQTNIIFHPARNISGVP